MPEAIVATAPDAKTVLVLGAGGFLGGFIVAALGRAGFRVRRGVRETRGAGDAIACDLAHWTDPAQWLPALAGIDAVVNVAGILRETRGQRFDAIHERAPLALARACVECGVRRFVQISALGDPSDGEFVASKHRCDAALLALPLGVLVLRPSVVYSASGAYGGTALLRAIAATPLLLPLPAGGSQRFAPLAAEDLADLVVAAMSGGQRGVYDVVGPEALTLREYLACWRRWLGFPEARVLAVPAVLVSALVACGDAFGRGPLTGVIWRMLQRGNVGAADAHARLLRDFGTAPRALDTVLATRPAQVQDRWQARLHPLGPLLRAMVVLLFALSAWAGFATDAAAIEGLAAGSPLAAFEPVRLARVGAALDGLLALALLIAPGPRVVLAMLALVAAYTLAFGIALPALWLDPLGGLAKNLVLLPALAVLAVLSERR
ncbi:MAG: NAD(P)H-binding protein [Xanthomonadales bacterium]|nr:NAD(P)H-binding protein [Xanthomonadales bacterium]